MVLLGTQLMCWVPGALEILVGASKAGRPESTEMPVFLGVGCPRFPQSIHWRDLEEIAEMGLWFLGLSQ